MSCSGTAGTAERPAGRAQAIKPRGGKRRLQRTEFSPLQLTVDRAHDVGRGDDATTRYTIIDDGWAYELKRWGIQGWPPHMGMPLGSNIVVNHAITISATA
jgi:hypothetical protein